MIDTDILYVKSDDIHADFTVTGKFRVLYLREGKTWFLTACRKSTKRVKDLHAQKTPCCIESQWDMVRKETVLVDGPLV